jgi:ABC-type branched-subunit amino acid transport system permease subunit
MFIIGILLMAVVLFLENGLMGLADVVRRALLAVQRRSGG